MKSLQYLRYSTTCFFAIICISCGNDTKKLDTEINEEASQTIKNASKVVSEAENMQEDMIALRNKTPLTKEAFESWLPKTLLDLPRSSTSINFLPGLSSCSGTYSLGNKKIRVMVIDGAGEKGAGGVGPYRMSSKMDFNQEDEWGYQKSKTIQGIKLKESYRKSGDAYALSMFYNDRFAVDIKTSDIDNEELEQILEELNLDQLSNL